jgi:LysM repeat protein
MFGKVLLLSIAALVLWGVVARPSSSAQREHVYIVRPNDTLWSIAARTYGGDVRAGVWKLEQRNGLRSATLVPGQRLRVPG